MRKTRNPDALIRIEDAIKVLCREKCYPGMFCPDNYCVEMWDEFEDVERVDAVPVVRCKDCKWGREVCGNIECFVDSNIPPEYHGYEWFCPNGERRTDDRHDKQTGGD